MSEVKEKKRSQSTNTKCPCIFPARRLAERNAWSKTLSSHSVERVASASIFWNFWRAFKRCSRQTPAMQSWRNVRTQSETKNHCLPPCLEKMMIRGKVATLTEEDSACANTGGCSVHVAATTHQHAGCVKIIGSRASVFHSDVRVSRLCKWEEFKKKVEDREEEEELMSAAVLLLLCRLIYDSLISAWSCSSYVTISPRSSKNDSRNVSAGFPLLPPLIS